jgi:DNA-binding protein H-NS
MTDPSDCESTSKLAMKNIDLNAMSVEELWMLHEAIASILAARMEAERVKLAKSLHQLGFKALEIARQEGVRQRRPYPEVRPKFRNPSPPHQTWAGRGKQPHWIRKLLASGKTIDDFRIAPQTP